MSFISWSITQLNNASNFFYDLYLEAFHSAIIPKGIANSFYQICLVFNELAWSFYDLGSWLSWLKSQVDNMLSWESIRNMIRKWLPGLETMIAWFSSWTAQIGQQIAAWWQTIAPVVQAWIQQAMSGMSSLINQLQASFIQLKAAWDQFSSKLPTIDELITWFGRRWESILQWLQANNFITSFQVDSLINSMLKTWFPFYDDLVRIWQDIIDFFTDPQKWIYERLDDFFERFW